MKPNIVSLFCGVGGIDSGFKKAGFNTIFVKRLHEWGPDTKISIDGNYDMVIEDFNELKEIFD